MADWTVGLLFGRSSSEMGQLGHPPKLEGFVDTPSPADPAEERAGDREVPTGGV
jgi:hypothetical protein